MIGLANPWVLLGLLAWTLFVGGAAYQHGHETADNACAAAKAAALEAAIKRANATARKDNAALLAHETERERIRTVFQPIREEVIRYVETHAGAADECLDPDGLRLWRAANAGRIDAPAAAQPDYTLSGLAAATLGPGGRPAGQPRTDGGAVPRMPGAAEGAGGLGGQR